MFVRFKVEENLARDISSTFLQLDRELNQLLRESREQLSEEDFAHFRSAVGEILGIAFVDVMKNIYECYPNLKPSGMP